MCIRDRARPADLRPRRLRRQCAWLRLSRSASTPARWASSTSAIFRRVQGTSAKSSPETVSYTHLDVYKRQLSAYLARGGHLIGVTPLRDDLHDLPDLPDLPDLTSHAGARWLPIRPGSDTALLLALCHTLLVRGLADEAFLATHTVGRDELAAYLTLSLIHI